MIIMSNNVVGEPVLYSEVKAGLLVFLIIGHHTRYYLALALSLPQTHLSITCTFGQGQTAGRPCRVPQAPVEENMMPFPW